MRASVLSLSALLCLTQVCFASQSRAKEKELVRLGNIETLVKDAEKGDAESQCILGMEYSQGQGVPQDYGEAEKWYRKAAEQGHAKAQHNLAMMYYRGEGVPRNREEAAKWYQKAAEQGHVEAEFQLGWMYSIGQGVAQDRREALKWYTKAAEGGDANGQFELGAMYVDGEVVPRDYGEAVKWYRKAAEQGHAIVQYKLALMYVEGKGVAPDHKEALKWYMKAAEGGFAGAQHNLAVIYARGEGVLQDYVEAYKWALLAAMNGGSVEQSLKETLRKRMTSGQIEEGQRRAREFLAARERQPKVGMRSAPDINAAATGFLITPDGYLLTACHAIAMTSRVEVLYQGRSYAARIVSKDESTDAAVLRIEGTGFPCLPFVSSSKAKIGDAVFTLGFPQIDVQGVEAKFTEGSISSLSGPADSPRFFQISVPVQPGNSGGPLVNEKGEVVGLIISRLNDIVALRATGMLPQTVNYAMKSSFVLPLVESVPNLAEKLARSSTAKDRSDAIEKAKNAVVLIVGYGDAPDPKGPPLH